METLCWKCRNAKGNGCSWFRCFKPVKGWEAEKVIQYQNCKSKENQISYAVQKCPEFCPSKVASKAAFAKPKRRKNTIKVYGKLDFKTFNAEYVSSNIYKADDKYIVISSGRVKSIHKDLDEAIKNRADIASGRKISFICSANGRYYTVNDLAELANITVSSVNHRKERGTLNRIFEEIF